MDCSKDAVHRPPVAGIAGCVANGGAVSIVLSGGYIGNEDYGDHFAYSGSGSDGNLKGVNMAMAITCAANFGIENVPNSAKAKDWRKSKAIRVVRGSKGDKNYSPKAGYRYDGIYKIHMYEKVTDNQVTTFRYHLRRDDPRPPPWKKGNSNVSRPSRKSVCERRESSSGKVLTSHTKSRG
jgi:E3 ubiquitin-protein ligase UHRF1